MGLPRKIRPLYTDVIAGSQEELSSSSDRSWRASWFWVERDNDQQKAAAESEGTCPWVDS